MRRADRQVRGEQDHLGTPPAGLLGERNAHSPRGAVSDEADAVERLARAARRDQNPAAGERPGLEQSRRAGCDLRRLCEAPDAPLSLGQLPLVGPDQLDAARAERLDVGPGRRMGPHARVHRRRNEHRPAMGEGRLCEHVVGDSVSELRQRVRRARRDDEQVGARQMGIDVFVPRPPGEREKGLLAHEALRSGRDEGDHLVPGLDEEARQLARLVGGDAAGDAKQDTAHAECAGDSH